MGTCASHLSCGGCVMVHVLEDRDQPELDGEGGGLPGDHLQQLGAHVHRESFASGCKPVHEHDLEIWQRTWSKPARSIHSCFKFHSILRVKRAPHL